MRENMLFKGMFFTTFFTTFAEKHTTNINSCSIPGRIFLCSSGLYFYLILLPSADIIFVDFITPIGGERSARTHFAHGV